MSVKSTTEKAAAQETAPILNDDEFVVAMALIEKCPIPQAQIRLVQTYSSQFKARFSSNGDLGKALFPNFFAIMRALDSLPKR